MVVLKTIDTAEEVGKILAFKDNVERVIIGDRGEWVQWLTENVVAQNERIIVFGAYKDEELAGYLVALDGRNRPLSWCVYVLFVYSTLSVKENEELWGQFIDWIQENDLPKLIKATSPTPEHFKIYGFDRDSGTVPMIMRIE